MAREIWIEKWRLDDDGSVVATGIVPSPDLEGPPLGTFEFAIFPEFLDVQLADTTPESEIESPTEVPPD